MDAKKRFGDANMGTTEDFIKAGLVENGGLHHGYTHEKKPRQIGFTADTGTIVIGPSGFGKYSTHLAYQLLQPENTLYFDPKGEAAATSGLMMPFARCYFFNPFALWTEKPWYVPAHHRFNLLDFTDSQSPVLFEDMLTLALDLVNKPKGGVGASEHFWSKAVEVTANVLTFLKQINPDASLIDFYNIIGDMRGSAEQDYFLNLHYPAMMSSSFLSVQQVAGEMLSKREKAPGEYEGILSTISTSLQILGSPSLQRTLSGKSTISMPALLDSDTPFKLFIVIPIHLIESCAGIIRALISSITISQQRKPKNRLHIILDEAGQLGNFTTLKRLYSFGRGSKTRITSCWQNVGQGFDNLGKDGFDTVFANAQSKFILGVGSEQTARYISDFLGKTTYQYDPWLKQSNAQVEQTALVQKALRQGKFSETLPDIAKAWQSGQAKDAVSRPLRTTDELLNMSSKTGLLSLSGLGLGPYEYQKRHYFTNRDYAHRFLPNPFHAPFDEMNLPTRNGRTRRVSVISETVPDALSHFPQFAHGMWSYPQGHCPYQPKRRWFAFRR